MLDSSGIELRRTEDISPAFDAFKSRVQALYVCADALVNANSVRINTLALGAHLPTMYATRSPFVDLGGLIAYGPNNADLFRRAANYVDKILRGAKPSDLPVEQPTSGIFPTARRRADRIGFLLLRCTSPLLAQSRHHAAEFQCLLLGVKRTLNGRAFNVR